MGKTPCTADFAATVVAPVLPRLHEAALDLMFARKTSPVATYLRLLTEAQEHDLNSDAALTFRTRFNGYCGVRRNAEWRAAFYGEFQSMKVRELAPASLFAERLTRIEWATGRVEASFVSKAVATLHPTSPVIDKVLRDRFAALVDAPRFGSGRDEALAYYAWLADPPAAGGVSLGVARPDLRHR